MLAWPIYAMNQRRNIRDMPFRRRHDGITVLERLEEVQIWSTIVTILTVCLVLPGGLVKQALMATILALIQRAQDLRDALWGPLLDIEDGITFCGEYALLVMWYRLHSPALLPACKSSLDAIIHNFQEFLITPLISSICITRAK